MRFCLGTVQDLTSSVFSHVAWKLLEATEQNWTWNNRLDRFKTGTGVHQGCILSLYLFNFYAEYIMPNGLAEVQTGIKITGRNTNNLRYADDTTQWQKGKKN